MENSLFKTVKEQVDARELVAKFLGEPPEIHGDHYYWNSPFNPSDENPSFSANSKIIGDFSSSSDFGLKQDIFNFIVKYNDLTHCISQYSMNNFDALKWVNETYKLGFDLSDKSIQNKTNKSSKNTTNISSKNKKIIYKLEKVDELTYVVNYGVEAYFDEVEYDEKPKKSESGKIKNRINKKNEGCWPVKEVKEMILRGQTCIPSAIKSKKDWVDNESAYQIFMIDFDNAATETILDENLGKSKRQKINYTVDDERHISTDKILKYCEEINLLPTFIYTTFSHTAEQHKFRLVYILDKPTQELKSIEGVYETLKDTFKDYHIDNSATDIARMFFGGREIVYESDNYYKIIEEEVMLEECDENNKQEIKYSEIEQQCNEYLEYTQYEARNRHLGYITKNDTFVPISNFLPFCINKINYINGNDRTTKYEMKCVLIDSPQIQLPTIIVDANAYAKCDFILGSSWDKHCIISAGNGNSSRLREVMQLISRKTMNEKNVYTHTGFRKVEDKLCYLYHRRSYWQCRECRN